MIWCWPTAAGPFGLWHGAMPPGLTAAPTNLRPTARWPKGEPGEESPASAMEGGSTRETSTRTYH